MSHDETLYRFSSSASASVDIAQPRIPNLGEVSAPATNHSVLEQQTPSTRPSYLSAKPYKDVNFNRLETTHPDTGRPTEARISS